MLSSNYFFKIFEGTLHLSRKMSLILSTSSFNTPDIAGFTHYSTEFPRHGMAVALTLTNYRYIASLINVLLVLFWLYSMNRSAPLDVIIVGGGLSGLYIGHSLAGTTRRFHLLEARSSPGGRLQNDPNGLKIDLGGAWIWPEHQPHMRELVKKLAVPTFRQPDDPSSTRLVDGAARLIEALAQTVDKECISLNCPVTKCTLDHSGADGPVIRLTTAMNAEYTARQVVMAAPPKLLVKHIVFDPPLSPSKQAAMASSHTWMAGVTKVGLVYARRFWDESCSNMGLPDGPAFQVYDSSTEDDQTKALTFFTLATGIDDDRQLADRVAEQMARIWHRLGRPEVAARASTFDAFVVHRWPQETYLSEDVSPPTIHPHPMPVRSLAASEWDGLLHFAGSESDLSSPGVMEGAIGAAKRVLKSLL